MSILRSNHRVNTSPNRFFPPGWCSWRSDNIVAKDHIDDHMSKIF
jgi:hypothetical protein